MAAQDGSVNESFASIQDAAKAYSDITDEAAPPEEDNRIDGMPRHSPDGPAGDDAMGDAAGEDEFAADDTDDEGDAEDEDDDGSPAAEAGSFAGDSAKVRLADGSVTTIAALKKGNLLHADWTRKSMAVAEERKAVEARQQHVQALESELQQQRETVAAFAQFLLPRRPDPQMLEAGDVVGYNLATDAYNRQMEVLGRLNADHQAFQQRQQVEQHDRFSQIRRHEAEQLFERAGDLANPDNYARFWNEAIRAGEHYGYSADELAAVNDHRQYLILRDALAYRRIKARNGHANAKAQGKPPVINGDRRRSQGEQQRRTANEAMARLKQTGSLRDGVAALLATEKG